MLNWFESIVRVEHWNPAGPLAKPRAWLVSVAAKRYDGCSSITWASARKPIGIDSGQPSPELLGAVVFGDGVIEALQSRAIAGEIALLLRVLSRTERSLNLLQGSGFGR
jgi:hypothetical protein